MTDRQRELRDYIRAQLREFETVPTRAQMASALRTTPSAINWLLSKLESQGRIEIGRGWRNIRLREAA